MTSANPRDGDVPTSPKLILLTIAITLLMGSLSSAAVPIALPRVIQEFGDVTSLAWVMTAFLLSSVVAAPIFGKLGDVHGRKFLLVAGVGIFVVGSALSGLAVSLPVLVVARVVQGFGSGGLMVVSMALIADVVDPRHRARIHGIFSWVFAAATIAGPVVGGLVVDSLGWRWTFLLNVPVGLMILFVVTLVLRGGPASEHPVKWGDYSGTALLIGFLSSVLFVTSTGGVQFPWTSGPIVAGIGAAVLFLAGFIWVERRSAAAIIPRALFSVPNFSATNVLLFFVGVVMFVEITFLPIYLQVVKGVSPTESGLYLLPLLAAVLVSSIAGGTIVSKTGRFKGILAAGMLTLAFGMAGLGSLSMQSSMVEIFVWTLIVGLGLGPAMSITIPVIQNAVPQEHLGIATASAGMFRSVGGSIGVSLFGMVFSFFLAGELGYSVSSQTSLSVLQARVASRVLGLEEVPLVVSYQGALQAVFLLSAVVAMVGLLVVVFMREVPAHNEAGLPAAAGAL